MPADPEFYRVAERRIEIGAIVLGVIGTVVAFVFWKWEVGLGVAVGAVISCLNYRWMRQAVGTMVRLTTPKSSDSKVPVPTGTTLRTVVRYALLIGAAYVILHFLKLPVISLLAGFSAVLIAMMAEAIRMLLGSGASAVSKS